MRLIIADDHPLFRVGLKAALEREGFSVLAEAGDGEQAVVLCLEHSPQAVLLDIKMPLLDGISAARTLRQKGFKGLVAMLTTFSEPALVQQAAQAGADAFWSKEMPPDELAFRLKRLAAGQEPRLKAPALPTLTPREKSVLELLSQGLSTKEIAQVLLLSPETVKDHLFRLYSKLGAKNRVEAIESARELGFLS